MGSLSFLSGTVEGNEQASEREKSLAALKRDARVEPLVTSGSRASRFNADVFLDYP